MSGASALPLPTGDPAAISGISARLAQNASRADQSVLATQGSSAAFIRQAWSDGAASRAACGEAGRLSGRISATDNRLRQADSALSGYAAALRQTRTTVTRLQGDWDEADAAYRSTINALNRSEARQMPDEARQHLADRAAHDREASQAATLRRYERALDTLSTQGAAATRQLNALADETIPRDKTGSPEAMRASLTNGLDISTGAMKRGVAQADAAAAKDLLAKAAQGDAAALAELKQRFGDKAKDPYFAQALQQALGPKGTDQLIYDMLHGQSIGHVENRTSNDAVLDFLGTAFATAANPEADKDMDIVSREGAATWRGQWFEALKADGRSRVQPHSYSPWFSGYYAQGLLLSHASVPAGAAYMDTVGADFLAYDREGIVGNTARSYIHGFPQVGSGEVLTPGVLAGDNARLAADPMNGFLRNASADGAASRALLLHGVPDPKDSHLTGIDYLMKQRWQLQHPEPGGTFYTGFADKGDALGAAALAGDHDSSNLKATLLASKLVNNYVDGIGAHPAGEAKPFGGHPGVSDYGYALSGLRDSVGSVMAYHIGDLDTALGAPARDSQALVVTMGGAHAIVISHSGSLDAAIGDLALDRSDALADPQKWGDNPPALARVLAAEVAYTKVRIGNLGETGQEFTTAASSISQHSGVVLGRVAGAAALGLQEASQGTDAVNAMVRKLVTMGAGEIPIDKIIAATGVAAGPGGAVITTVAGKGFDSAVDLLANAVAPDGAGARAQAQAWSLREATTQLLVQQIRSATLESHPWTSDSVPTNDPIVWQATHGGTPFWSDAAGTTIIPPSQMTDQQWATFEEWAKDPKGGSQYLTTPTIEAQQSVAAGYQPFLQKLGR